MDATSKATLAAQMPASCELAVNQASQLSMYRISQYQKWPWQMQKLSLISILTLLVIGSAGGIITVAMNPFHNATSASAPNLNTPQLNSNNLTSSGDPSSSTSSTSSSTTSSSGLLANSTGLLTNAPPSSSGGDDGSGDDGSSICGGVVTQTNTTTTTFCTFSHDD